MSNGSAGKVVFGAMQVATVLVAPKDLQTCK